MTLLELTSGERSEQGMWTRSMVVPQGEVYIPLPYGPRSLSLSEFSKPSSFLGFNLPCARLDKQTFLLFSNLIILLYHTHTWTGILIPSTCVKLIQWTSLVKTSVTHKRTICSVEIVLILQKSYLLSFIWHPIFQLVHQPLQTCEYAWGTNSLIQKGSYCSVLCLCEYSVKLEDFHLVQLFQSEEDNKLSSPVAVRVRQHCPGKWAGLFPRWPGLSSWGPAVRLHGTLPVPSGILPGTYRTVKYV